tara:strand:- start:2213 stop:2533 length:321 start_codon:yes stop_codon:yes gene_type:complete
MNGTGNNAAQAAQMRQQVLAAPDAACGECKGEYFENVFKVKRISALMSPNGQETMVPVQTLRCLGCGNTLDEPSDFAPAAAEEASASTEQAGERVTEQTGEKVENT